jgi:hypothetical protein
MAYDYLDDELDDPPPRRAELVARCGQTIYVPGELSSVALAVNYLASRAANLDGDYRGRDEIELEFLTKLAPLIEAAVAQAAGFQTWADFTAERDAYYAALAEARARGEDVV